MLNMCRREGDATADAAVGAVGSGIKVSVRLAELKRSGLDNTTWPVARMLDAWEHACEPFVCCGVFQSSMAAEGGVEMWKAQPQLVHNGQINPLAYASLR